MKVAIFAKAIGLDPTKAVYVPFQGGGEAMTAVLGGHAQVGALDLSEAAGQIEAGKIRALAVMADRRSSKFKDIPTTTEQGVNATYLIWRGYYMAPGVTGDAAKWWTEALRKMVATPEWAAEREKLGWEPIVRFGDDFKKYVLDDQTRSRELLKELGFVK